MHKLFLIVFLVTIENAQISTKDTDKGERFCPTTPRYMIHIYESYSHLGCDTVMCGDGAA